MYLGIDVGATKTLIAIFNNQAKVVSKLKFPTPKDYPGLIKEIGKVLEQMAFKRRYAAVCCALPALIDHKNGLGKSFGNLPWVNVAAKRDLEKLLPKTPVFIENDAKLAGFYEASTLKSKYSKVLYLTISTGIGAGLISNGKIDPVLEDTEPGQMLLLHADRLQKWEHFASGKALYKRYGKKASEIDDPKIWQEYSVLISQGLGPLLAVLQPQVVVIGGGVGAHFEKFKDYLAKELRKVPNDMVAIPPILKAKKAEEAVIYGCYEYARQETA